MYDRKHKGEGKGVVRKIELSCGWEMDTFAATQTYDSQEYNLELLEQGISFLWKHERLVFELMKDGKTMCDIAEIMVLESEQHAYIECQRVIFVLRYYVENLPLLKRLYKPGRLLNRREIILLRLLICDRLYQTDIATHLGVTRNTVFKRLQKIERILGDHPLKNLVISARQLRTLRNKERFIMKEERWRELVKEWILKNTGKIWYEWGGQDIDKKRAADCSGLVLELLKKVQKLPKSSPDTTATGLSKMYPITKTPKPGDLAFYGRSWQKIRHVMFYIGEVGSFDHCVAGMGGGRKNMTAEWAKLVGSGLWVKTTPSYRNDFIGYRKVI
jgi:cell wall-associated NlpC family hydrolase